MQKVKEKFNSLKLNHILRCFNNVVDALAKMASCRDHVLTRIFTSDLMKPSIGFLEWDSGEEPSKDLGLHRLTVSFDFKIEGDSKVARPSSTCNVDVLEVNIDLANMPNIPNDWSTTYIDYLACNMRSIDIIEAR